MTIPTSGSYDGISIYQGSNLTGLGGAVGTALTALESALTTLGLSDVGNLVSALAVVYKPLVTDGTASFSGSTVTSGDLSLNDATVTATSANAFEFTSGNTSYVLSNGTIPGLLTVDSTLTQLESLASAVPLVGSTLEGLVATLKAALDDPALNLGGLVVIPGATFDGSTYTPPCFVRGTRIATTRGDVAVEDLREGDLVRLARGGEAPVKWIGHRRVDTRLRPFAPTMQPVRVKAGALDGQLPVRDLRVSPDHALFLEGVLVPAGLLVNDRSIVLEAVETVEYFHIELDRHDVILAEGAAAETYLDTGNRQTFANAPIVALAPEFGPGEAAAEMESCAPMVLEGERLEAIRAAIAAVAPASAMKARLAS